MSFWSNKKYFFLGLVLVLGTMIVPKEPALALVFNESLSFGSFGPKVSLLQEVLKSDGSYQKEPTGKYDENTRQAVSLFQKKNGISPSFGYFGPATRDAIDNSARAYILAKIKDLEAKISLLIRQIEKEKVLKEPFPISPQSIVGLNCYSKTPSGTVFNHGKGSGVIIREDGLILTARHVVDLGYSYSVDPSSVTNPAVLASTFEYCTVGFISESASLPLPDAIRKTNPFVEVPLSPYKASLFYKPSEEGLSSLEADRLDYAVLKIDSLVSEAPVFGINSLPKTFPSATLLPKDFVPEADQEVLTYGYPADMTEIMGGSFNKFYLVGGVGKIKSVADGDYRYKGMPFLINTNMEVRGGRSGSPLFLSGRVAGIISAYSSQNIFDSYSVSIEVIRRSLGEMGVNL